MWSDEGFVDGKQSFSRNTDGQSFDDTYQFLILLSTGILKSNLESKTIPKLMRTFLNIIIVESERRVRMDI